jgi:hypothetical protein
LHPTFQRTDRQSPQAEQPRNSADSPGSARPAPTQCSKRSGWEPTVLRTSGQFRFFGHGFQREAISEHLSGVYATLPRRRAAAGALRLDNGISSGSRSIPIRGF